MDLIENFVEMETKPSSLPRPFFNSWLCMMGWGVPKSHRWMEKFCLLMRRNAYSIYLLHLVLGRICAIFGSLCFRDMHEFFLTAWSHFYTWKRSTIRFTKHLHQAERLLKLVVCASIEIIIGWIFNSKVFYVFHFDLAKKKKNQNCKMTTTKHIECLLLLDSIPMEDSLEVQIELSKDYLKQDDWYPRRNKFGGGDYFARPYTSITSSRSINGHKKSDSRCKWGLLRHHCWRWWSLSQWAVKVWKKLKYINKYFFKNESRYGCRTNLPPEGLKLMIF